jgi:hypothetical protein
MLRRSPTIDQYNFNRGIALADGLAEFLGIEIREMAIEKKHLPESFFQMNESLGATAGLLHASCSRDQTLQHALAHGGAGTGYKDMVRLIGQNRKSCHADD